MYKISFRQQLRRRRQQKLFLSRRFKVDLFGRVLNQTTSSLKYINRNLEICSVMSLKRHSRSLTPYGSFLYEKQRLRAFYGHSKEGAFKKFIVSFGPKEFLGKMESRIDIFLYRSGLFKSYEEIRQTIRNGLVFVNGFKVCKVYYFLKENDEVTLEPIYYFKMLTEKHAKLVNSLCMPLFYFGKYAEFSPTMGKFIFYGFPTQSDLYYPFPLKLDKVMNYYRSIRF